MSVRPRRPLGSSARGFFGAKGGGITQAERAMKEANLGLAFTGIVIAIVMVLAAVSASVPLSNPAAPRTDTVSASTLTATSTNSGVRSTQAVACAVPCNLWSRTLSGAVVRLAVSSDGSFVAAGTSLGLRSGTVYLFNRQGDLLWSRPLNKLVLSIDVSSDASLIVVAASQLISSSLEIFQNGSVYLFDRSGNLLMNYTTGYFPVLGVKVSSDSSKVFAVTDERIISLDRSGAVLWEYATPTGEAVTLDASADGNSVVAAFDYLGNSPTVYSWSFISFSGRGDVLWNHTSTDGRQPRNVALSSDASYVLATADVRGHDGIVYLFNRNGELLWSRPISPALSIEIARGGSNSLVHTLHGTLLFNRDGMLLENMTVGPAVNSEKSCELPSFWARDPQGKTVAFLDEQGRSLSIFLPDGIAPRVQLSSDGAYAAVAVYSEAAVQIVFLSLGQPTSSCSSG